VCVYEKNVTFVSGVTITGFKLHLNGSVCRLYPLSSVMSICRTMSLTFRGHSVCFLA
jgi:hypothetical protein